MARGEGGSSDHHGNANASSQEDVNTGVSAANMIPICLEGRLTVFQVKSQTLQRNPKCISSRIGLSSLQQRRVSGPLCHNVLPWSTETGRGRLTTPHSAAAMLGRPVDP